MSDLVNRINSLHANYNASPEQVQKKVQELLEAKRLQASQQAINHILKDHEDQIINAATMNKKSTRIYEWCHADQIRFNGCFLRDLLNRGELLKKLQARLDELHGVGNFKIYHLALNQRQVYSANERHYAIYISWDQSDFERLDKLITSTLSYFSLPPIQRQTPIQGPKSDRWQNFVQVQKSYQEKKDTVFTTVATVKTNDDDGRYCPDSDGF